MSDFSTSFFVEKHLNICWIFIIKVVILELLIIFKPQKILLFTKQFSIKYPENLFRIKTIPIKSSQKSQSPHSLPVNYLRLLTSICTSPSPLKSTLSIIINLISAILTPATSIPFSSLISPCSCPTEFCTNLAQSYRFTTEYFRIRLRSPGLRDCRC
jgi:hypothetical protein